MKHLRIICLMGSVFFAHACFAAAVSNYKPVRDLGDELNKRTSPLSFYHVGNAKADLVAASDTICIYKDRQFERLYVFANIREKWSLIHEEFEAKDPQEIIKQFVASNSEIKLFQTPTISPTPPTPCKQYTFRPLKGKNMGGCVFSFDSDADEDEESSDADDEVSDEAGDGDWLD